MVRVLKSVWAKFIPEMILTFTYHWEISDEEVSITTVPTSANFADGWLAVL